MNPLKGDHSRILERESLIPFDICGDNGTNTNQPKSNMRNISRGISPSNFARGPSPAVRCPAPVSPISKAGQQSRSGSPIKRIAVLRPRLQQPRPGRSQTLRQAASTWLGCALGAVRAEEEAETENQTKGKQAKEKGPFHVKRALKMRYF